MKTTGSVIALVLLICAVLLLSQLSEKTVRVAEIKKDPDRYLGQPFVVRGKVHLGFRGVALFRDRTGSLPLRLRSTRPPNGLTTLRVTLKRKHRVLYLEEVK